MECGEDLTKNATKMVCSIFSNQKKNSSNCDLKAYYKKLEDLKDISEYSNSEVNLME